MRVRVYETKTLVLLADFNSDHVPRVGEHITLGPHLNVGDIHLEQNATHRVLNIIYQAPWCVHAVVDLGVPGFYLGDVVDDSILEALRLAGEPRAHEG